jgi:hypothetical protein
MDLNNHSVKSPDPKAHFARNLAHCPRKITISWYLYLLLKKGHIFDRSTNNSPIGPVVVSICIPITGKILELYVSMHLDSPESATCFCSCPPRMVILSSGYQNLVQPATLSSPSDTAFVSGLYGSQQPLGQITWSQSPFRLEFGLLSQKNNHQCIFFLVARGRSTLPLTNQYLPNWANGCLKVNDASIELPISHALRDLQRYSGALTKRRAPFELISWSDPFKQNCSMNIQ